MENRIKYSVGDYVLTEKYGLCKIVDVLEEEERLNELILDNGCKIETTEVIKVLKQNNYYDEELTKEKMFSTIKVY